MKNVVLGFLGTTLDSGKRCKWRPTVALCTDPNFHLDRLELLHDDRHEGLASSIRRELAEAAPHVEVLLQRMNLKDPWDFPEVYGKLFDFAREYGFDEERERYHIHLTTGTHVAQICWFLLAESRHIPARLIQTSPPRGESELPTLGVIDLDLSRYNAIQQRFDVMARDYSDLLKGGIETKSPIYNTLIDQIELVATSSDGPLLLQGESGTGKTELAERIFELKLERRRVKGRLVHINCATLRGASAQATLFGQRRSFTGQTGTERAGLLREADGGVLFLDEVDALGWDEQALLLHAIETGRYHPLGADHEVTSRFHVIAGCNQPLEQLVAAGKFRADLFSRLAMWCFDLPPLRERHEDIEANLIHELARAEKVLGTRVGFNADAQTAFLRFAHDPATLWQGNFRDFGNMILRLCTLAPRGRITRAMVEDEIDRLKRRWETTEQDADARLLSDVLGHGVAELDPFDKPQLAHVIRTCQSARSLSDAGRRLFAHSRTQRQTTNDADRLRKYLARFGLDWNSLSDGRVLSR